MMPRLRGMGLALLLSLGALDAAAVTIDVQGDVLNPGAQVLGDRGRLLDAITQARPKADAFWLGAHYARRARAPEQAQLKAELLAGLRERRTSATSDRADDTAACLDKLAHKIISLPVTGRLPQTLDPYVLELDPRANRRLQEGDSLIVPARPSHIVIHGLVRHELRLPYRHGQLASEYLAQAERCAGADLSHAWLIYPDGTTRRIGVAYWNEEPANLAPGARLVVPLAEDRWDDAAHILNARMADFLATQPLP